MTLVIISLASGTLLVMAIVMSYVLGWANKAFYLEINTRVEEVHEALPGANCGGCGYIGCREYAEAVALSGEEVNKCQVGGQSVAEAVARIMGVELGERLPYRPIVHCGAHYEDRLLRSEYYGEKTCVAVNLVADVQGCTYGCLGFGDCANACNYDALHVIDGLATVDYEKCVGCGACGRVCPRNIITITPFKAEQILAVTCSNKDSGKDVTRVCSVGCIGCKACQRASSLFKVENNLSTIDYDKYDPNDKTCTLELMNACEKCPRHRIVFVGKPRKKDIEAVKDEKLPEVVEPYFKTTVDDTEWRG